VIEAIRLAGTGPQYWYQTGVAELHQRVSAVAPTLSVLYLYDRRGLYLFTDGVRLDLTYKPPSLIRVDSSDGC
jgi:hypothetical protein